MEKYILRSIRASQQKKFGNHYRNPSLAALPVFRVSDRLGRAWDKSHLKRPQTQYRRFKVIRDPGQLAPLSSPVTFPVYVVWLAGWLAGWMVRLAVRWLPGSSRHICCCFQTSIPSLVLKHLGHHIDPITSRC